MKIRPFFYLSLLILVFFFIGCKNNFERENLEKILGFSLLTNERATIGNYQGILENELVSSINFKPINSDSIMKIYSLELGGDLLPTELLIPEDNYLVIYEHQLLFNIGDEILSGNTLKYIAKLNKNGETYEIGNILYYGLDMTERVGNNTNEFNNKIKKTNKAEFSFSAIRGRLIAANENEVIKILGRPDRELKPQMAGDWKIFIYYSKVHDDFESDEIKHLVLLLIDNGSFTYKVNEIQANKLGSTLTYKIYSIPLP